MAEGVAHVALAEVEAMAFEDGYSRCAFRAHDARVQRADYQVYVELVARYGVPFSEDEFNALGPKAGSTFRDLCNDAAIKWQKMWWFYAPVYRLRRDRASTIIQRRIRGVNTRRRWAPIVQLRLESAAGRTLILNSTNATAYAAFFEACKERRPQAVTQQCVSQGVCFLTVL